VSGRAAVAARLGCILSTPGMLCCRASVQKTCMLDVLLFSEAVAAGDQLMPHLFPVNSLRCLSMSHSRLAAFAVNKQHVPTCKTLKSMEAFVSAAHQ
jgi:hypothetical protein